MNWNKNLNFKAYSSKTGFYLLLFPVLNKYIPCYLSMCYKQAAQDWIICDCNDLLYIYFKVQSINTEALSMS